VVTTGSAASSASNRLRTPAVISDCAHSAAVSGSGYSVDDVDDVTSRQASTPDRSSTPRSVDMATTDHPRPVLQHELTYSDMEAPKGLRNSRGENNCFLNSAVQVTNVNSPSIFIVYRGVYTFAHTVPVVKPFVFRLFLSSVFLVPSFV